MAEHDPLHDVAGAISDGESVDWESVESSVDGRDDPLLMEQLRLVAGIADFYRVPAASAPDLVAASDDGIHWGHLRLLGRVGSGAFGEVYRAWDTRLEREVALKLVPRSPADRDRAGVSVDEGRLLARVRHPNVVTVYGAERIGDRVGIWTEFIQGRTLEEILREHGPFGPHEAALIGIDLCRALAAIHKAGLLHRDIKAQNVMREQGGRIVLMDFGTGRRQEDLTSPQADLAGTPLYLAPEIFGGAEATERSDIYSLGVLLYRLVTGSFPVRGRTFAEIREAHARGERVWLRDVRPDLPDALVQTIERTLVSDVSNRYQSAGALEKALQGTRDSGLASINPPVGPAPSLSSTTFAQRLSERRVRLGLGIAGLFAALIVVALNLLPVMRPSGDSGGLPKIRSIAVLPFANISGDQRQDFVADGLTDLLIAELARLGELKVISRTSVLRYQGARRMLPEIGRELDVDAIVEGSVLRQADRVRVTVQLINAATDQHIWARTYDRHFSDFLTLQSEVTQAIAQEIRVTVTPRPSFAARRAVNLQAQESYLRGLAEADKFTADANEQALQHFEEAIRQDSDYAPAYVGLAHAYIRLAFSSRLFGQQESYGRARAAVARALQLDPNQAGAYLAEAIIRFYSEWDWPGAARTFERTLELNPGNAASHAHYAYFLSALGRLEPAVEHIMRARELDPLAVVRTSSVAAILYYARRYDDALRELQRAQAMDPIFPVVRLGMARVYAALDRTDAAISMLKTPPETSKGDPAMLAEVGRVYAQAGLRTEAFQALAALREASEVSSASRVSPDNLAYTYAALGDRDRAFALLDEALNMRATGILWLKVDPRVDMLREDQRFQKLLDRLGVNTAPSAASRVAGSVNDTSMVY